MKEKIKTLYVLEKSPDFISTSDLLEKINENIIGMGPITIYIHNDGIQWLLNENWKHIFKPNEQIVYYANAQDAKDHGVPFQEGVIFSNPKTLYQLINLADQIFFIN